MACECFSPDGESLNLSSMAKRGSARADVIDRPMLHAWLSQRGSLLHTQWIYVLR